MKKKLADKGVYPRRFVPEEANPGKWSDLEPLFLALRSREPGSLPDLERWAVDLGELASCIDEEGARRYIAMTCDTNDPVAEKDYLQFVEEIEPQCKTWWQKLYAKYVGHPMRGHLSSEGYRVMDRTFENQVRLFREENIALEIEEAKLSQLYQKIVGAMTAQFEGKEQTLQELSRYLERPDRMVRQEAWEIIADRRLKNRAEIEEIFDKLVEIRGKMATNAGFDNYRDYAFRRRERFDYSPSDCLDFHKTIETVIVPAARMIQEERRKRLVLKRLRPWDLNVDSAGRPPLQPFSRTNELVDRCHRIFCRMDTTLGEYFGVLREKQLLDLTSRKGKAPGGYQSTLSERRLPFIFMNAVGVDRDVRTLLHESGHAFHTLECRDEPLFFYRESPVEFCEVASMTMELLGARFLDVFYQEEDRNRSYRNLLEEIIILFPWIAIIDAFQHWIYTHEGHGRDKREKVWLDLQARFGGGEDWTGHEDSLSALWQKQPHLFTHPFYYIEYGIAQLGALQFWREARHDLRQTLTAYRSALSLGGSKPLPELFRAGGIRFDFSPQTTEGLMIEVMKEWRSVGSG
jgi:oligoendopeptidase F